jgi:hypothetical protein
VNLMRGSRAIMIWLVIGILMPASKGRADELMPHSAYKLPAGVLVAAEDADAYDPFADYNEFEEATDEEADINFFRNGRFLTLSMIGGYRGFTGVLSQLYKSSMYFGVELTYFFDLRFALQIGYVDGSHGEKLTANGQSFSGTATISNINFDLKYYLSTQNVTRGLAKFNPYFVLGLAEVYRTNRIDGTDGYSRDQAMGLDLGLGFEIPLLRNKAFFGLEAVYQYVNFPDAGNEILINGVSTGIFPNGQIFRAGGVLGINF